MPATVFADQIFPGAKIITASLSVSNTSGSYSTTVSDDRMTGSMKAIALEIADPSVFNGKITVNATAGQYTFSCPDTAGSTTVVISFIKTADDPTQLTSSEFDVLNNRIGDLTTLTTTAKTSAVAATNELQGKFANLGDITELWSDSDGVTSGEIQVSEAITNFEWIIVRFRSNQEGLWRIARSNEAGSIYISEGFFSAWGLQTSGFYYYAGSALKFTTSTKATVYVAYSNSNLVVRPTHVFGVCRK